MHGIKIKTTRHTATIYDLMRGRISFLTLDAFENMAAAGLHVEMRIPKAG
jgi:hypothetical protein